MRSAIPRNSVAFATDGKYPGDVQLRCTTNAVVVYSATTGELLTYDLKTNVLTNLHVAALDP